MKSQHKLLGQFSLLLYMLIVFACSKDDNPTTEPPGEGMLVQGAGLSFEDIDTYAGEIGIVISTRSIAKKGYTPSSIELDVDANTGDFDTTLSIDPLTYIIVLKYPIDTLTDAQLNELTDGVDITVRVLDGTGAELANQEISNVSFVSNPNEFEVASPQLADLFTYVDLRPNTRYTVQFVKPGEDSVDGAPYSVQYTTGLRDAPGSPLFIRRGLNFDTDDTKRYTTFEFTKVAGQEDVYTIGVRDQDNTSRIYYLYILDDVEGVYIQSRYNWNINGGNTNATALLNYRFRIKKESNGLYTISPARNNIPLKFVTFSFIRNADGFPPEIRNYEGLNYEQNTADDPAYFRILPLDASWEITTIESKFEEPLLPPASTTFGFNSTLTNCSNGLLTTEVGTSQTTESSTATRWAESMGISTRNESTVTMNFSAQLTVPFRGITGMGSFSYTTAHTFSREISSTRSRDSVITETETIELFSKRTQEVPPKSAVLISDNCQSYDDIKVPYIQKLRIRADLSGAPLTGREIVTQFGFNGFDGVITAVDGNSIDVTLRGNTTIDKLIDTEVFSQNVPDACD